MLVQAYRSRSNARPLAEHFAAAPPSAATTGINLPPLPPNIAGFARTALAHLAGGEQAAALTPVAQNSAIQVTIKGLAPSEQGLHISGQIKNISTAALPISLSAFHFTDEQGTQYAASGGSSTTVAPGQSVPLDMTLPIPQPRQLTLRVELSQPPLTMVLIQDH
ncbi:MAG: hypothetical protein H0X37_12515 [Herpetosiphonaceae bacterium]|nr:hypothetical protein [Herpetosiphonaceae bacterium]